MALLLGSTVSNLGILASGPSSSITRMVLLLSVQGNIFPIKFNKESSMLENLFLSTNFGILTSEDFY